MFNKTKLRGHHLICLNFFRGEGYSEDFIENIYSVLEKKELEVVEGPDIICAKCPYLEDEKCSNIDYSEKMIRLQDKKALELLDLKPGEIVNWNIISGKIPLIIEKWKSQFCLDCGYKEVCFG